MAKQTYDEPIDITVDWNGDESTGGKPVSGRRVKEFVRGELERLSNATRFDATLDEDSPNAVQNQAVTREINELRSGTVFDMEAEVNDEQTAVTVTLIGKQSNVIASCEIPYGGGAGGGDTAAAILNISTDKATVKLGGKVFLSLFYDFQYISGDDKGQSTGKAADVEVRIQNGSQVTYAQTFANVRTFNRTIDITDYLLVDNNDIYVTATWRDDEGQIRTKTRYASVKAVALSLSSEFNLGAMLAEGGFDSIVEVPYRVSGSGTKSVQLWIDGQRGPAATIIEKAPTPGSLSVDFAPLAEGLHSLQLVATMETEDGDMLSSESIYITAIRKGASSGAAIMLTNENGTIFEGAQHLSPSITARAYEPVDFSYGGFGGGNVALSVDSVQQSTINADGAVQPYNGRFRNAGTHTISVAAGGTIIQLTAEVEQGLIDISDVTYGLACYLNAEGRSNNEPAETRNQWVDREITTSFQNVDWITSGWTGNSLRLLNGAKAMVNIYPLQGNDVKEQGRTIEMTLKISNKVRNDVPIVSIYNGARGFRIQGDEIAYLTGETTEYPDEDNPEIMHTREIKLSTNYQQDKSIKVAFVIDKIDTKVMHLYVDGNRVGADLYTRDMPFSHSTPQPIVFDSTAADIELESVRVYNRNISDDEELANAIADNRDISEMVRMYNENNLLSQGGSIDMPTLLERRKGVILIVGQGTNPGPMIINDLYNKNDKKFDFDADVYYYSPYGTEYDFYLNHCNIRIQGTSSTKYPIKNIRIYFNKSKYHKEREINGDKPYFTVGGQSDTSYKYALRPGAIKQSVMTAKADYSDSSMSLNTGGAKLFNDVLKELNLLTPPQRWQKDHGQQVNVRAAVDGIPVDIFAAESIDSTPVYYGQYNFNNEKSKSGGIFGMEGVSGFTATCPIALESLNNTQPLCLFNVSGDLDDLLDGVEPTYKGQGFDKAFEFNYPEDTFWSSEKAAESSDYSEASADQKTAIRTLMQFIKDSVPEGADNSNISTFSSQYFKDHVAEHFDVDYLLTYYLWTEFFVSVDQRAKNIIWRTWDGIKWYPTYYDGDTQRGKRNDSFMVYDPETERDTWDVSGGKWAFEGHDSWLWNLVLANLQSELSTQARTLMGVLTADRTVNMLVNEQSGNWSDRQFNKSGELKYITPAVNGVANFIYALQGADREHSEWFIRQRWALMAAKYGSDTYREDNIDCYIVRKATDTPSLIGIIGNKTYAYGYGTNNSPSIYTTGIVGAGVATQVPITEAYTQNDPVRIYGASRIVSLDLSGASNALANGINLGKCTALEEIDAHVPNGAQPSNVPWWLDGYKTCSLLRSINLKGQVQSSTSNSTKTLDLEGLTRIESVDIRGTQITSAYFVPGCALRTLHLPATMTSITLEQLQHLQTLTWEGLANVESISVTGCPSVNTQTVVQQWLSQAVNPQSLTLDGVNWTLTSQELLSDIVTRVGTVSLSGRIHIDGAVSLAVVERCKELFGVDCLSPGGSVHITFADEIILDDETQNPPLFAKCKAGNLCANEHYMTRTEAEAVTESTLYYANFNGTLTIETADEFRYFTGVTAMPGDFFNMYGTAESARRLRTITIPTNVGQLRENFLYGCVRLERITFLPMRAPSFYSSGHFFDVGKAVTGQKIMEIPRGSTGYNNNTGNWAKLASYTITYID